MYLLNEADERKHNYIYIYNIDPVVRYSIAFISYLGGELKERKYTCNTTDVCVFCALLALKKKKLQVFSMYLWSCAQFGEETKCGREERKKS